MNPHLYNNKYRIDSSRLKHWDYGRNAAYFVTICTKNRENFFGEILDGEMHIAHTEWMRTSDIRDNVVLDEFVVMPNHMHGILIIDKTFDPNAVPVVIPDGSGNSNRGGITGEHNPMIQENLSRILRWYKGRVTFECRKIHADFSWQGRFHDHIIGDEGEFERIKNYIIDNPSKWNEDKFYSK